MPWFKGYAFNNVNVEIGKYWNVNPDPPIVKAHYIQIFLQ